jgi:hypothetical protein
MFTAGPEFPVSAELDGAAADDDAAAVSDAEAAAVSDADSDAGALPVSLADVAGAALDWVAALVAGELDEFPFELEHADSAIDNTARAAIADRLRSRAACMLPP